MDGDNDGAVQEGRPQEGAQGETQHAAQAQVTGAGGEAERARAEYEAALAERDERIAALEGEIAEAAKTAEAAEKLRAEMDEQRIGFELQMAGCRSVKAARALLDDHGGDVAALKEAEPWLFEDGGAAKQSGKTVNLNLPRFRLHPYAALGAASSVCLASNSSGLR